jgi:hypothetical protein
VPRPSRRASTGNPGPSGPVTRETPSSPTLAWLYAITADLPVHDRVRTAFDELALSR